MAAELEERLAEETELVKSSGGIFEVEDRGELIFSKRELKRFPEGEEIFEIIQMVDSGEPLDKARKKPGRVYRSRSHLASGSRIS